MEEQIKEGTDILFNLGVAGVFIVFLIIVTWYMYQHIKKMSEDNKEITGEFMKRTDEFIEVTRQYSVHEAKQSEMIMEVKNIVMLIKDRMN